MQRYVGLISYYPEVMGLRGNVKQHACRQLPRAPVIEGGHRPTLQNKSDVLEVAS
jgi:hypothetical protein